MTAHLIRQARSWIDLSMSRLGLNTKPTPSHEMADATSYTDISKQPYQIPGDGAAVRSLTEHAKETPAAQ